MLLGTLGTTLFRNTLPGKSVTRAGKGTIKASQDFWCHPILWLILKYKDIIKINPNLMVLFEK